MFHQIETDGQGVTLRPSHLRGTNGCTRLPVEANPLPSKSPSQIDCASSATKKQFQSACSQPQTSMRNGIFLPMGFKLSLGMLNIPLI